MNPPPALAAETKRPLRAVAFFDGQNLFHAVKAAFGVRYPNFDPHKLAKAVCLRQGLDLCQTRFYTGVPASRDSPVWNHFWTAKLGHMGRQGIHVYSRPLRYRTQSVTLPDLSVHSFVVGQEKGIDVRISLDIVRLAQLRQYDVAVVFSQDQDLSEVADDIRVIAKEQGRYLKIASAFPIHPKYANSRGINKTDWLGFDKSLYAGCLDTRDYQPKSGR